MKKQFVKPGIKVVEIDEGEIICTSVTDTGSDTPGLVPHDTPYGF